MQDSTLPGFVLFDPEPVALVNLSRVCGGERMIAVIERALRRPINVGQVQRDLFRAGRLDGYRIRVP